MSTGPGELIGELMEQATRTMPVDTSRLVAGAVDRGAGEVRRHRWRAFAVAGGSLAVLAIVGAIAMPAAHDRPDTVTDLGDGPAGPTGPAGARASGPLELSPKDDLVRRFTALLPGTSTEQSARRFAVAGMDSVEVAIDLQLTNGRGVTGYVGGDFAVGEPLSDEAIANSEAACRDVQPKGGDECLFVPGGMIDLVDDSSPPADPTGLARGIRMAWVNYIRWDGAFATLRALNSPAPDVPTEPGVMPVVRTDELVQLVQQMVWYEDRSSPRGTEQTGPRRLPGPRRGQ